MTDFTEGPWTFDNLESGQIISIDKEDEDCCEVICDMLVTGYKEWDANAHLVATAPDMYVMLEMLVNGDSINDDSIEKEVLTLLAKARGE